MVEWIIVHTELSISPLLGPREILSFCLNYSLAVFVWFYGWHFHHFFLYFIFPWENWPVKCGICHGNLIIIWFVFLFFGDSLTFLVLLDRIQQTEGLFNINFIALEIIYQCAVCMNKVHAVVPFKPYTFTILPHLKETFVNFKLAKGTQPKKTQENK